MEFNLIFPVPVVSCRKNRKIQELLYAALKVIIEPVKREITMSLGKS